MTISAEIIADSISPEGIRLTTMQLRYPRFIHAEFMTHRVFSRNASSSRAIPIKRLIEDVERDPAMPVFWGKNQKGMQAQEDNRDMNVRYDGLLYDVIGDDPRWPEEAWREACQMAIRFASALHRAGYHKQIVNRLLEPFAHINVVVTATEWANFYALRRHPDAQPEMKALADAMWEAQQASEPTPLSPGQWHLPYVTEDDWVEINAGGVVTEDQVKTTIKISVARCARVSYLTHDGRRPTIEEDLALYERLIGSYPMHASPAEHQATPDKPAPAEDLWRTWQRAHQHGNFWGWIQYRKTLPGEAA